MSTKKFIIIITISSVLFIAQILFVILLFLNFPTIMDTLFMEDLYVPEPEITYMEFPVRIEYTINGETKLIEDTMICEYKGYEKESNIPLANFSAGDFFLLPLQH